MVVLEQNPFEVASADISEIRVLKTLLSGEVIFDADTSVGQLTNAEEARMLALNNWKASGHAH